MKSIGGKDIAELVGIAAIVASLIFVGMELRQPQKIAIASQYQAHVEFNIGLLDGMEGQKFIFTGNRVKGWLADMELSAVESAFLAEATPKDLGRIMIFMRQVFFIFDNNHFQYQAVFMDEESWQAIRRRVKNDFKNNVFARISFTERSFQWRESLVREFEDIYQEIEDED